MKSIRYLIALVVAPFLMGFEPDPPDGLSVGMGGGYGRGRYSTGCAQEMYRQEGFSGNAGASYTFAQEGYRAWRPKVTVGGLAGESRTETKRVAVREEFIWRADPGPVTVAQVYYLVAALQLDWSYLGLYGGVLLDYPEWSQADIQAPALPLFGLRLGPWNSVYLTGGLGESDFSTGLYPLDLSLGAGCRIGKWSGWIGYLASGYEGDQGGLKMTYAIDRVTLIGSLGLMLDPESSFPGHDRAGAFSQAGLGFRYSFP
jgi:hypothetical protein